MSLFPWGFYRKKSLEPGSSTSFANGDGLLIQSYVLKVSPTSRNLIRRVDEHTSFASISIYKWTIRVMDSFDCNQYDLALRLVKALIIMMAGRAMICSS